MTAGALLLQVRDAPHLPVFPDLDHGDAMRRLNACLTEDYRIPVRELTPTRTATPEALRRELSAAVADMRPSAGLVVMVRGHLSVFDRAGGRTCRLALRDSVRGRPASMMGLRQLVEMLTGSVPGGQVVLCIDADLLATRLGGAPPTPEQAVGIAAGEISDASGDQVSTVLVVNGPRRPGGEGSAMSLIRAVDSVLRSASAAGRAVSSVDLVHRVRAYLEGGSAAIRAVATGSPLSFVPRPHPYTLPDYIIEDLYSPDPGSRLDAVTELVELAGSGNALADSQLNDVRSADPSAQVRGFAQTLWRRADAVGARQLLDFGLIPGEVWERAGQGVTLPALTNWFTGTGTLGVDAPTGQVFERPAHAITVRPFRIARRPVTNYDYLVFVAATDSPCPDHWNSEWVFRRDLDHPVVMVSWHDARRYCVWLTEAAHRRGLLGTGQAVTLPTEASWEIAARNAGRHTHPWGSIFDPTRCNVRSTGIGHVHPVGTFSPRGDSPSGVVDLIGNVWEWTASAWGSSGRQPSYLYPYDADDGREDPNLPTDVRRIIRGGAFYYADVCANSYTRNRALPTDCHPAGGFRVAVTGL